MGLYRIGPWRGRARRTWDPWRDMEEIRQAMEQIASQAAATDVAPALDLYDAGVVLVVRVDLPGMKPADLTVAIEDGALRIDGHRTCEGSGEETFLCRERRTGRFGRSLQLPAGVDVESAKATLVDGVLEIVLPKDGERSLKGVVAQIDVVGRTERPAGVAD
jgi:HSP20 family protein